jgi:hypothetical protein
MKMEQTECYEMSAYKIQTPGNYPEKNIQRTEHGESLKSRINEQTFSMDPIICLMVLGMEDVDRQTRTVCKASHLKNVVHTRLVCLFA